MDYVIIGVFTGATYAIVALGFVVIYSVVRVYPFYQGALVVFCSYTCLWVYEQTSSVLAALGVTLLVGVLTSIILEFLIFGPLRTSHFASLIAAIGLQLIFVASAFKYFYYGDSVPFPNALRVSGSVRLLGTSIEYSKLLVFGVAVTTAAAFDLFFRWARPGMQMRAISNDESGAELCGIRARTSIRWAFGAAGVAAAVAGVLVGIRQASISPQLADPLTIKGLAAILLAGATNLRGTLLCALLIGVVESLAIGYGWARFSDAVAYVVIVAALCIRPQGLFGEVSEARA